MPTGGCLSVNCYPSGKTVILEVADTGTGIAQTVGDSTFFKTTTVYGSGLGLTIVRQIIAAHHGTIDYTRGRAGGTKCRVAFARSSDSAV